MSYSDMIAIVKRATSSIVDKYYPSKSNNEKMSLHDLIAFAIMAHIVFDGIYKKAYKLFIEELKLFPKVRYNKIIERLNRYENLLIECLKLFKLEGQIIVDSKSLETKKPATATGSLWLSDDDLILLIKWGKNIWKLNIYAKTNLASTNASVRIDAYGKA